MLCPRLKNFSLRIAIDWSDRWRSLASIRGRARAEFTRIAEEVVARN